MSEQQQQTEQLSQTGGEDTVPGQGANPQNQDAGRRRRHSKRQNPWLSHVKQTMKNNRGLSFKQVLKLAKKTFKRSQSKSKSQSQSQSQSAGRRRKRVGSSMKKNGQNGGSGMPGKAPFGENAAPVV